MAVISRNSNGTFVFNRSALMQNGQVTSPLQRLGVASIPWYYTSPLSPGNTPSYFKPVTFSLAQPYDFARNNGR